MIDLTQPRLQNMEDLLAQAPKGRVMYRFKVPVSLHPISNGVVELGFLEITPDEELMAANRCGNKAVRLAYEQAKESLREIGVLGAPGPDGAPTVRRVPVNTGDATADRAWGQLHPKLRGLCVTAYHDLHNPKDKEVEGFLESREASAG